jgi:hypothetical protein
LADGRVGVGFTVSTGISLRKGEGAAVGMGVNGWPQLAIKQTNGRRRSSFVNMPLPPDKPLCRPTTKSAKCFV